MDNLSRLSRFWLGMLITALGPGCSSDISDVEGEQTATDRVVTRGIAVNSPTPGYQIVFRSKRSDISTHLQEVLAGQHGEIKDVTTITTNDKWDMIELPTTLMPSGPKDTRTYDLAKQKEITFRFRMLHIAAFHSVMAASGVKVDLKTKLFGTFECDSASGQVSGSLEFSGSDIVSAAKMTSYPGGGQYGFAVTLIYDGPYPYPNGVPGRTELTKGGLYGLTATN